MTPARPLLTGSLMSVVVLCGCGSILEVNDPDVITGEDLTGAAGVAALHAGALGAYRNIWDFVALDGGALADEFTSTSRRAPKREYDRRMPDPGLAAGLDRDFEDLHEARALIEFSAARIPTLATAAASTAQLSEVESLAGMTYIHFAENFCSGVPFGSLPESGAPQYGAPVSTDGMFTTAAAWFQRAHDHAGTDPDLQYLAAVGLARALLNRGDFAGAEAAVAGVPTGFVYRSERSSDVQNEVFFQTHRFRRYSVSDLEGGNGLPFRSANDPRVPWQDRSETGDDGSSPHFRQLKYAAASPIVVTSGLEARLIQAEALLDRDDPAWLVTLNAIRADSGMAPLADPGSAAGRVDLLFRERAFWTYATGHRLGDLRRLVRQYGRDPESVFPTGSHPDGTYGTDVNFPIPDPEIQRNPNSEGCLDPGA